MSANFSRKSFLLTVLVSLVVMIGCALAADDADLVRDIGNGIRVECNGVYLVRHRGLGLRLTVVSEIDSTLKIGKNSTLYDTKGGKFSVEWIYIGDDETTEREIIGEVATPVSIVFRVRDNSYKPTETYARVDCEINGKKLTFRSVPFMSN